MMICDRCHRKLTRKREQAITYLREHGVAVPFERCVSCAQAVEELNTPPESVLALGSEPDGSLRAVEEGWISPCDRGRPRRPQF